MGYAKHHYVERALMELNFRPDDAGISDLVIAFAAFVAKKHSMSPSVSVNEALAGDDVPDAVKGFILGVGSKWADLSLSRFEKVSDDSEGNTIWSFIIPSEYQNKNQACHRPAALVTHKP